MPGSERSVTWTGTDSPRLQPEVNVMDKNEEVKLSSTAPKVKRHVLTSRDKIFQKKLGTPPNALPTDVMGKNESVNSVKT